MSFVAAVNSLTVTYFRLPAAGCRRAPLEERAVALTH